MQLFHAGPNEKDSAVAARIAARPRARRRCTLVVRPAVACMRRASYEKENPETPDYSPRTNGSRYSLKERERERESARLSSLTSWTRN
jgi:hypothetical protein